MVRAWQKFVTIPTYKTGDPDKNPLFLEKRVYQGSSGAVYPHAVIDKITDEKENKNYLAVFLENEYLQIMILPQLGGRIQMALDKTNGYHFVYYNQVIKPALVGLAGPWISGGIEFNWPQHHRPSTFDPMDFTIEENNDGSITVWVNEVEQLFHTKGMAGFTLHTGKAYLEIKGRLYNRTPIPQTFLWWANPAVSVDEHYQSIFPPDVHAVYDHGKRDVSSFPIATGTYYKVDYSPGTDISWYKNIQVPTSYMAVDSKFDFVGGYHHGKKAGILHIADHHISPGKKQWTWGSGEFGRAWDRQLTDEDGPYFELMTGMFTDNQPDFGWIMPNEARQFSQYFMPYKNIGYVKNATIDAAVNLEAEGRTIRTKVYVTAPQEGLTIRVLLRGGLLFEVLTDLDPAITHEYSFDTDQHFEEEGLRVEVLDQTGRLLVDYTPVTKKGGTIPEPAMAIGEPASIASTEELFLAARHLEQYRHATFSAEDYYREALRRDPFDIRNNQGLGAWYFRKGKFELALAHFDRAIQRSTRHNPNPYDAEVYYQRGLALYFLKRFDEAYTSFYKTYWSHAWQDSGALYLARIDCIRKKFADALGHVTNSIQKNYHGFQARHLKAALLRQTGEYEQALRLIDETLQLDPFQTGMLYEQYVILAIMSRNAESERSLMTLKERMRAAVSNYLELALDYAAAGLYEEADDLLRIIHSSTQDPMVCYYLAYLAARIGDMQAAKVWAVNAAGRPVGTWFTNRLEDIEILQFINGLNPEDHKAWYYLGNIWYDKRQYDEAIDAWKKSAAIGEASAGGLATVYRNLGLASYNVGKDPATAIAYYEKAFQIDTSDARVLYELDNLYKRTNRRPADRLAWLKQHELLVRSRDDLFIEYVTLHNLVGEHLTAAALLAGRNFHPWEGGEGKVSGQYVLAQTELAKLAIAGGQFAKAIDLLKAAQTYPDHLGEGKLFGTRENDIHFWKACAYQGLGKMEDARRCLDKAMMGDTEPAPAVFYNDQSPDKILYQALALKKIHCPSEAKKILQRLTSYARKHVSDEVRMDYFAVSLPDLLIFDDDLTLRNRVHCLYMEGLGNLGLEQWQEAKRCFEEVLSLDASHLGATLHLAVQSRRLARYFAGETPSTLVNNRLK
jgi:tetratricopeptide (TPR) repeat protein